MPNVFGVRPRPRALILGFGTDHGPALAQCFPTSQQLDRWEPASIEQTEWDVLVTTADVPPNLAEHIYVIAFGVDHLGYPHDRSGFRWANSIVSMHKQAYGTEFHVSDDLDAPLRGLVEGILVPEMQVRPFNLGITERSGEALGGTPTCVESFVHDTTGLALAGRFVRLGALSECWCLPRLASPATVIPIILDELSKGDPTRFPRPADWRRSIDWETAQELAARERLLELREQRATLLHRIDSQIEEANETLTSVQQAADAGDRSLLTAQGDDLVAIVAQTLEELGFTVRNMDLEFPENDRREDLRLKLVSAPDWEAIVEVRGYRRGAQLQDLLRIGRFAKRFILDEKRAPSAMWYIVNQNSEEDPARRQTPLASNPSELAEFGKDGGVVIDTVDLFRALRTVRLSRTDAASVSSALIEALERWTFAPASDIGLETH